jgi:anti-sigma-K factor RskA
MSDFPELHRAFPRPSDPEAETALHWVLGRYKYTTTPRWRPGWRIAAAVTGLAAAYGAGFIAGRRDSPAVLAPPAHEARMGAVIVRPPELVARPQS